MAGAISPLKKEIGWPDRNVWPTFPPVLHHFSGADIPVCPKSNGLLRQNVLEVIMWSRDSLLLFAIATSIFISCSKEPASLESARAGSMGSNVTPSPAEPAGATANLPAWTPREELLSALAAEEPLPNVPRYRIRLPNGYRMAVRPDSNSERQWIACFPDNAKLNTLPPIRLFVGMPPPGQETRYTLRQASDVMLGKDRQEFRNWNQEASAEGTVNGLHVVRTPWTGTSIRAGTDLRGVTYAAFDGTTILNLTAIVPVGDAEELLPLLESAVLTFRNAEVR